MTEDFFSAAAGSGAPVKHTGGVHLTGAQHGTATTQASSSAVSEKRLKTEGDK